MKKYVYLFPLILLFGACNPLSSSSLVSSEEEISSSNTQSTPSNSSDLTSDTTPIEVVKTWSIDPNDFPTSSSGYPDPSSFIKEEVKVSYVDVMNHNQDGHDAIQVKKESGKITLEGEDTLYKVLTMTLYANVGEYNPYRAHLHIYDIEGTELIPEVIDNKDSTFKETYKVEAGTSIFRIENNDIENARAAYILSLSISTVLE